MATLVTSPAGRAARGADGVRALEVGLGLAGLIVLGVMAGVLTRDWATSWLWLDTAAGLPLWGLLLISVPATVLARTHALSLTRYGGAVVVAFDSAVLAYVLWLAAGSALSVTCGELYCPQTPEARALLGVGAWTLMAWMLGVVLSEVARRRAPVRARVLKIALGAVAGSAVLGAAGLFRVLMPLDNEGLLGTGVIGPLCLIAIILAAVLYVGVDFGITSWYVAGSERVALREVTGDSNALVASAASAGVMCSAVLAALLTLHNAWALALLVPVTCALVLAAGRATEATIEREGGRALYRAAASCQRAESVEEIAVAVEIGLEEALHACARLVEDEPGAEATAARVSGGAGGLWLRVEPRAHHRGLSDREQELLSTFAVLAGQSVARVRGAEAVRRLAERDELTGVSTRRVMHDAVAAAIEGAVQGAGPRCVSMVYCDIDDFKRVNDTWGHGVGDDVLVEVARRLLATVRPGDTVARLGGDEFAVLLPGADAAVAQEVARRLTLALEVEHDPQDGRAHRVAVSLGSATWPAADEVVPADRAGDWLLEQADRAMYVRKHTPRVG